MTDKPKCLDLFCGAGGVSMGLYRAGFDVTGVDIEPQPNYPFRFIQADALTFDLSGYDMYAASPPCQFASEQTPLKYRAMAANLIPTTRARLSQTGKPFIIENVENARRHLIHPVMLCGSMFSLKCFRHRYFEIHPFMSLLTPPCCHNFQPLLVTKAGSHSRAIGNKATVKNAVEAYGIDWMNSVELAQAIPPAYSEYLGKQVIAYLERTNELAA